MLIKLAIYVGVGIIVGIIFGHTSIFGIMALVGLTTLSYLLGFLLLIIGALRRQMSTWNYASGFLALSLTIAVFVSLATMRFKADANQTLAEEMISEIDRYKQTTGRYPATLSSITTDSQKLEIFNYSTDEGQKTFELSYFIDGWHQMSWSSESKNWKSYD